MGNPTIEVASEAKKDLQVSKLTTVAALILTVINIIGGVTFWLSLPEQIKQTKDSLLDHEARLRTLESDRGLLQRIDERTKSIQDDLHQLHQDFSFRASAKP